MSVVYLACLLVSLCGLAVIDARLRLALWRAPRRSTLLLVVGVAFLVCWDLVGIALGVFLHTPSPFATGLMLAPQLPVEELVFLVLLCYLTLLLLSGWRRSLERKRRP